MKDDLKLIIIAFGYYVNEYTIGLINDNKGAMLNMEDLFDKFIEDYGK